MMQLLFPFPAWGIIPFHFHCCNVVAPLSPVDDRALGQPPALIHSVFLLHAACVMIGGEALNIESSWGDKKKPDHSVPSVLLRPHLHTLSQPLTVNTKVRQSHRDKQEGKERAVPPAYSLHGCHNSQASVKSEPGARSLCEWQGPRPLSHCLLLTRTPRLEAA